MFVVFYSVYLVSICFFFFFFNDTATTEIYTLSLHDALPIRVLAVHDAGLVRMQLQTDFRHPQGDGVQDLAGLGLGRAVRYCIIGVPLEGDVRELPGDPSVERIMQEQICQQGRDRRSLWGPAVSLDDGAILPLQ